MYKTMLIFSILILLFIGCGNDSAKKVTDGKLNVVTTIGMITDIAKSVGGDRVRVTGLMGPGVDPHLYKASAGDVQRMQDADLLLYNGLHLEGAMAELFEKLTGRINTAAVSENIPESLLLTPDEFEGAHDPHLWFDVTLWMKAVERVNSALIELDPEGAEQYQANTDLYLTKLEELHKYVIEQTGTIPEEKRVLITAHDAFNYFGRAYGFDVRGLQGISTVSEAGTADMQAMSSFIADNKIPTVFVESSVPRNAIEALEAAVHAKGFQVSIGGELFSDAMGDTGTEEGTYIGMVRHNINTIASALRGDGGE